MKVLNKLYSNLGSIKRLSISMTTFLKPEATNYLRKKMQLFRPHSGTNLISMSTLPPFHWVKEISAASCQMLKAFLKMTSTFSSEMFGGYLVTL